jgi:hypothetical protein
MTKTSREEIEYFGVDNSRLLGYYLSQILHRVRILNGKPELNSFSHFLHDL